MDLLAIESRKGLISPTIVSGRAPANPDEVVLGTRTLRELHRAVDDDVEITLGETSARFRIVRRAVFPDVRVGEGAATTLAGIRRLQPDLPSDVVLVRRTPDAAGTELLESIKAQRGVNVYLPEKPADLAELDRIGGLPSVLAAGLAGIVVLTVGRRWCRRCSVAGRDLAVLKALGFSARQVSALVAWQSNAIALIAIVLGVPLGIVGGELSWRWFAGQLGVPTRPAVSNLVLAAVVIFTLALANLIALFPARLAARTERPRRSRRIRRLASRPTVVHASEHHLERLDFLRTRDREARCKQERGNAEHVVLDGLFQVIVALRRRTHRPRGRLRRRRHRGRPLLRARPAFPGRRRSRLR